ncbi:MAG: hypothetical protein IPL86_17290 [Flavobacteriales bacterium]|nr:hypothetical protein [Flavobacteriales bacterium]
MNEISDITLKVDVKALIREHLVPKLRSRAFVGSYPHFRRVRDSIVELLTFPLDKWGTGNFVVEIARAPNEPFFVGWGDPIDPKKLTAHHIMRSVRLGASGYGDCWFDARVLKADPTGFSETFAALVDSQGDGWAVIKDSDSPD